MSDVSTKGMPPGSSMFLRFVNWMLGFISFVTLVAGVAAIYVGLVDGVWAHVFGVRTNAAVLGGFFLLESLVFGVLAWIGVLRIGRIARRLRGEDENAD